jgi:hypothetical protein
LLDDELDDDVEDSVHGVVGDDVDLLYDGLEELVTCDDEELECDL